VKKLKFPCPRSKTQKEVDKPISQVSLLRNGWLQRFRQQCNTASVIANGECSVDTEDTEKLSPLFERNRKECSCD